MSAETAKADTVVSPSAGDRSPRTPSRADSRVLHGGLGRTSVSSPLPVANKNVEWINSSGAWTFYLALISFSWLLCSLYVDSGMAWTYVHLFHGVLSYYLLHWTKGSPVDTDQGKYDKLTFWEQLDDGMQNTSNRKFFAVVPVALFLLATHGTDYRRQPLGLNLLVVVVLLVAKLPGMHKVRILGINA